MQRGWDQDAEEIHPLLYFAPEITQEKEHGSSRRLNTDHVASPRRRFTIVAAMLAMVAIPAGLTLHRVQVSPTVDPNIANSSPYS